MTMIYLMPYTAQEKKILTALKNNAKLYLLAQEAFYDRTVSTKLLKSINENKNDFDKNLTTVISYLDKAISSAEKVLQSSLPNELSRNIKNWIDTRRKQKEALVSFTKSSREKENNTETEVKRDSESSFVRRYNFNPEDYGIYGNKKVFLKLSDLLIEGAHVALIGPPGCGKTYIISKISEIFKWKMRSITGNINVDAVDLIGSYELINGNTVWRDGPVTEAVRNGYILYIDEVNYIDSGVMSRLNQLVDKTSKYLELYEKADNEQIPVHKNFRIILSFNPRSQAGPDANIIPSNIRDRFAFIRMHYMDAKDELIMLKKHYPMIGEETLLKIIEVANKVRSKYLEGSLSLTLSPRGLLDCCKLFKLKWSVSDIFKAILIDKAEDEEEIKILEDIVKSVFPSYK